MSLIDNKGNIIKEGVNTELDELRKIAFSGKDFLLQMQQRESERTGITSLKIAFNNVFGYYIEVRNTHKDKVPEEWIRKQTLVNAERYITEELKEYETKILGAEEKILVLESSIYESLVLELADYTVPIQHNANLIAQIDCLSSFASMAIHYNYSKPTVNDSNELNIKNGRHPVIETCLEVGEVYIPNDVYLDDRDQQIIMITGPNMSGKSAILRQTALIVLLAQMGSFVPAESVTMGYVDKIFTKLGEIGSPQMPMMRLVNLNKVVVKAEVSEAYLMDIQKGDKVTLKFPSINKTVSSRIASVGKFINPTNRTFPIHIELVNRDKSILPNLIAEVKVEKEFTENAILIPSVSILEDSKGATFVYIYEEGKAKRRAVSKLYVKEDITQISKESEVKEGDIIITNGASALVDGDKVTELKK